MTKLPFFFENKKIFGFLYDYTLLVFSQYQTRIVVLLKSNTFHCNFCFKIQKKTLPLWVHSLKL